jgi:phage gpG-like protein
VPRSAIKLDVSGDAKAVRSLLRIGMRAENVEPVSRPLERIFQTAEARQFESAGGGTWQPLADSTKEKKAVLGQNAAILRATDRLYHSLTSRNADAVYTFKPGTIELGTKVYWSVFHRAGTPTMPARPPIDLRPAEVSHMSATIGKYIAEGRV